MRRILATAIALLAAGAFLFLTLGTRNANTGATYKVELDNAFGLTNGADFKVAGVIVGKITKIELCSADQAIALPEPARCVDHRHGQREGLRHLPSRRQLPVAARSR